MAAVGSGMADGHGGPYTADQFRELGIARGLVGDDARQVYDAAGGMAEAAGRLAIDVSTLVTLPAADAAAVDARGGVRRAAGGDARTMLDAAERRLDIARIALRDARRVLFADGEAEAEAAGGAAAANGMRALRARLGMDVDGGAVQAAPGL